MLIMIEESAMSLAMGYDGQMSEKNKLEWRFYQICFRTFNMTGKIKFVDHMNNMAEKLKKEIEKRGNE